MIDARFTPAHANTCVEAAFETLPFLVLIQVIQSSTRSTLVLSVTSSPLSYFSLALIPG